MDYASALAADLESDSDDSSRSTREILSVEAPIPTNLHELLEITDVNLDSQLKSIHPDTLIPIAKLSRVYNCIPSVQTELVKYTDKFNVDYVNLVASVNGSNQSEEYRFLMELSRLPEIISCEILTIQRYVAARYSAVFPELEKLVPNAVDYCKIVHEIGPDLVDVKSHQSFLIEVVSGEKLLGIVMAAFRQASRAAELSDVNWTNLREACTACLLLSSFLDEISEFVADKMAKYAPNVSALVGKVVASQLLVSTGSLDRLAQTPSCNLPSLGVRDLLSHHRLETTHIRSTGYLYHCELISELPPEIVKQGLRILSGKAVLAARIDVSRSSPGGELGNKLRQEVQEKLDKLLLPPDQTGPKALPVPQERKSKKRAGRRLRKMKERFNMSELRKAQNRMEFGKEERTVTDSFGEEVGLGMSRDIEAARVNRNTDARLSKAMIGRLQKQKERENIESTYASIKQLLEETNRTKRPRII